METKAKNQPPEGAGGPRRWNLNVRHGTLLRHAEAHASYELGNPPDSEIRIRPGGQNLSR
jgi:hypothetical protein